jgi:hypothetical protein
MIERTDRASGDAEYLGTARDPARRRTERAVIQAPVMTILNVMIR